MSEGTTAMNGRVLREQLVELLAGEHAHVGWKRALRGLPPALRGRRAARFGHSIYEELEHMRLAQEDILRYTVDPAWRSPPWPEGYWPKRPAPTPAQWRDCVKGFEADLAELIALARRADLDLTARIPHGQDGHTYLREILLAADHNAYHLGQIVLTRKLLGAWPER
jgi:uncharacterized damage-inducible protein DinB